MLAKSLMLAKSWTVASFRTLTIGCTLTIGAAALAQETSPGDDPVVATVDGTPVHRAEVEAAARGLPEQMRQMPIEMLYGVLLDRVIDFRLLANEAERQNVDEDPAAEAALAQARAAVLREFLVQQTIEQGLTEDKLRALYEERKAAEGFAQEEVHARHILLQTQDEAKAVIEELEGGADFAAVAQEHSVGPSAPSGGDLGFISRDQVVPEFADAAFALDAGETSPPVQTQFGWHVIDVLERRNVEPSYDETAPQLRQELAREIVTALVEDLRSGAEIERFNMDGSPIEEEPEAGSAPEAEPETEPQPEQGSD
jgi:peptidyl-prolyl cis-trans isomerase C